MAIAKKKKKQGNKHGSKNIHLITQMKMHKKLLNNQHKLTHLCAKRENNNANDVRMRT